MKKVIIAGVLLLSVSQLAAQPTFGTERGALSYRHNEVMINPAYVAFSNGFRKLSVEAKMQWAGVEGAPQAQNIQFVGDLSPSAGIGAWFYHESFGITDVMQLMGAYGYCIPMENGTLSLGLQAGMLTTKDDLVTNINDPLDPVFAESKPRSWGFNAGIGAYYETDSYYVGLSIPQLLTNDLKSDEDGGGISNKFEFDRLHFYLMGGYVAELSPKVHLIPSALLLYAGSTSFGYEAMLSGMYNRQFRLGVGYAASNSIRAEAEAFISREVSLSYRFEHSFGDTYKHLSSTHSITLSVFWNSKDITKPRPIF